MRRVHELVGRPPVSQLEQIARVLDSDPEPARLLESLNARPAVAVGDFVAARGYLGQVVDDRVSGLGYRSVRVEFLVAEDVAEHGSVPIPFGVARLVGARAGGARMKRGGTLLAVVMLAVVMLAASWHEQSSPAPTAAYAMTAVAGDFVAAHPTMGLQTRLDTRGATLSKQGESWHATLGGERIGCGDEWGSMDGGPGPRAEGADNRVTYARGANGVDVQEWFVNGPRGLEQGFTLEGDPCAEGRELTIEVRVEGLSASVDGSGNGVVLRDAAGVTRLHYTDLSAQDADGCALAVRMTARDATIGLEVDTVGARFPVVVDPLGWVPTQELLASDGAPGDGFGNPIAISGATAVIGAYEKEVGQNPEQGAAYVFAESGGSWSQQAELFASDASENADFGHAVAIDGQTLIVCAPYDDDLGAAYVFAQTGSTWTQTAKLVASDGAPNDDFGSSIALSGNTLVLGAPGKTIGTSGEQQGAAYVFALSGSTWSQQAELLASDGAANDEFGTSVAVSGGTVLVGAPGNGNVAAPGAAYVFVQSGSSWSQQAELLANDGVANDYFGISVAIAGGTALVGASQETVGLNSGQGAADVFVQSGDAWTEVEELLASDGAANAAFGTSVAISGTTMLVGAPGASNAQGAAYVYVPSGSLWTQQAELTASNGVASDNFGAAVALAGSTAILGATGSSQSRGAAYIEIYGLADGDACTTASSCVSGNCVDGFCCDTPCTGLCQACAASEKQSGVGDGKCDNAKAGTNPHDDAACVVAVASSCGLDGECDGLGQCQYYAVGTACGAVCANNAATPEECDGKGTCGPGGANPTSCGAFDCVDGACLTACTSDSQCVMGAECNTTTQQCTNGSMCTPDGTGVIPPGGSASDAKSCAPYICEGSQCKTSCATVSDCVAPNVCTANGVCAPPSSGGGGGSGGCTVDADPPTGSSAAAWGIVLALAALADARRRKLRS